MQQSRGFDLETKKSESLRRKEVYYKQNLKARIDGYIQSVYEGLDEKASTSLKKAKVLTIFKVVLTDLLESWDKIRKDESEDLGSSIPADQAEVSMLEIANSLIAYSCRNEQSILLRCEQ